MNIHRGLLMRDAITMARALGFTVGQHPGTGELEIVHPAMRKPLRINCRRKDTPRAFVVALRHASRGTLA